MSRVWELVADPQRHPEWFPRVVDVEGEKFDVGDVFVQRTKQPFGRVGSSRFVIEARDELREIHMTCQLTGMFSHWRLADAGGGTFVDVEMGMNPAGPGERIFDMAAGRLYFRHWLAQTVDALSEAATGTVSAPR